VPSHREILGNEAKAFAADSSVLTLSYMIPLQHLADILDRLGLL
jgi:hypothetical protein